MSYATKEQLAELAAHMASQIRVPTIGIGGGYAPIGTIISYMGTSAPQDYLACDGSVKNIADYPQLADFFESQFGSKNYFGGDGTTTFGVPNLQGEFLRGTGTNSHENQGDGVNVGEHQDATEFPFISSGTNIHVGKLTNGVLNCDGIGSTTGTNYISPSGTTQWGTGFTSRPTNTSVLYCIKAVVAGDVYSTEERVVGTWLDGKPLYQRTYVGTTPSTADTVKIMATLDPNIVIKDISGMINNTVPVNYYGGGTSYYSRVFVGSSTLSMQVGAYRNMEVYITVRYTKTDD